MSEARIPVLLLGGSGYVTGELLRILLGHPHFEVRAVASTSQDGAVTVAFPHLAGTTVDRLRFTPVETIGSHFERNKLCGLLASTPHGVTAGLLDALLAEAEAKGARVRAVDLSADFRYADPARYAEVYGRAHGAPARAGSFVCAVPEHVRDAPAPHAAQPGCFTTAAVLAAYPMLALGLAEPEVFVTAVTGSSGSGRTPIPTTHHPERRSALFAYDPLAHRHEPEMRRLLAPAAEGVEPEVEFVPLSGPFVRGIYATVRLTLKTQLPTGDLVDRLRAFYEGAPFVSVTAAPPRLTEVVGTNRCRIGVAARGRTAVLTSVIDNLVKGAAGGGIQWLNRLFDLPDETGLVTPGLGWF